MLKRFSVKVAHRTASPTHPIETIPPKRLYPAASPLSVSGMDILKAIQVLGFHSRAMENFAEAQYLEGFVGSLNPYCGHLEEQNFKEVMECMVALKEFVRMPSEGSIAVHRYVHRLLHRSRALVLDGHDGERENKMTDEDRETLNSWLKAISETWLLIQEEADAETIQSTYEQYVGQPAPEALAAGKTGSGNPV